MSYSEFITPHDSESWQDALSDLVTDPKELFRLLDLDSAWLPAAEQAARAFPLKVPRRFLARIEKGNINDPLLRQVLPLGAELIHSAGYVDDPLREISANPVSGLLHKYQGRVLVTLTSACAVHCRYCFRRHFPYADNNPGTRGWENLMSYLANDSSISEVILSGGDPLAVSDKLLTRFTDLLAAIPHIKRLRIHTRLLIVMPERVTESFIGWIEKLPFQVVIVLHANHPKEINSEVRDALSALHKAGVHLLNQSVLLKDVNDDVDTLAALSESLFNAGVLPYYLHVLDKVQGAAHFDLHDERAISLHQALSSRLSGYLVPRLVRELPGEPAKMPVTVLNE